MLHIFYGTDSYSIAEAFRELRARLDADGSLDTNTVTFSATEATPEEVVSACNSAPFLGETRLVVIEGLLRSGARRRPRKARSEDVDAGGAGEWARLAEGISAMPESTVVVLLDGDVKSNSLLQAFGKVGEVHRLDLPPQRGVIEWVQNRARSMGLKLEGGAARTLAELVGNDTWTLASELAKLGAYAESRAITSKDISEMVTPAREPPPWDLLDPIADGKGAVALRALRRMLEKKHPLLIAAIVQSTYRRLAIARDMLDDGATRKDVGERLGLSGFPLEKLLDRAARYSAHAIRDAYELMVQTDYDIKRGAFDEQVSLELLVTDLAVAAQALRAA